MGPEKDTARVRFDRAYASSVISLLEEAGFQRTQDDSFVRRRGKHIRHVIERRDAFDVLGGGVRFTLQVMMDDVDALVLGSAIPEGVQVQTCIATTALRNLAGVSDFFPYGATAEESRLGVDGLMEMLKLEGFYFFDAFDSFPAATLERAREAAATGAFYVGPLAPELDAHTAAAFARLALAAGDGPVFDTLAETAVRLETKARGDKWGARLGRGLAKARELNTGTKSTAVARAKKTPAKKTAPRRAPRK